VCALVLLIVRARYPMSDFRTLPRLHHQLLVVRSGAAVNRTQSRLAQVHDYEVVPCNIIEYSGFLVVYR